MEEPPRREPSSSEVTFLTTEHFTLQTVRASSVAETNTRLQLYMGVLSSSILALALVAQIGEPGRGFYALAVVVLSVVFFLGYATIGRLRQTWREWFFAGQGMNRIRRYFVENAPNVEPYLVMPTHDDPRTTLAGAGINQQGRWWEGFVTAFAIVGMVNSVVGGAIAGLLSALLFPGGAALPAISAACVFLLVWVTTTVSGYRAFRRNVDTAQVLFPAEGALPAGRRMSPPPER